MAEENSISHQPSAAITSAGIAWLRWWRFGFGFECEERRCNLGGLRKDAAVISDGHFSRETRVKTRILPLKCEGERQLRAMTAHILEGPPRSHFDRWLRVESVVVYCGCDRWC
jgi:hypothetical protein